MDPANTLRVCPPFGRQLLGVSADGDRTGGVLNREGCEAWPDDDLLRVEVLQERNAQHARQKPCGRACDDVAADDGVRPLAKADRNRRGVQGGQARTMSRAFAPNTMHGEVQVTVERIRATTRGSTRVHDETTRWTRI
jgi:hypothetical protein